MAQAALSRSIAALVASADDDGAVQVQLSAIIRQARLGSLCVPTRAYDLSSSCALEVATLEMVDFVGD
jgi:hypothetical protein